MNYRRGRHIPDLEKVDPLLPACVASPSKPHVAESVVDYVRKISGLNEYMIAAMRTKAPHNDLVCAALGACGEAGEFADLIKKAQFHGHDLDKLKAAKELGDVLWYLALAADVLGFTLEQIAQMNILKLAARYPEGFTIAASHHDGG